MGDNVTMPQATRVSLKQIKPIIESKLLSLEKLISPVGEPVNIHRIEIPCERIDILEWLEAQTFDTKIYLANRNKEREIGGIGIADELKGNKEIPYNEIFEHISRRFDFLNPNLRYYGGHCFDAENLDKTWGDFGSYYFFVPRFEITQNDHATSFACNIVYSEITEESLKKIIEELQSLNFDTQPKPLKLKQPLERADYPRGKAWQDMFEKTIGALKDNTIKKIVLARKSVFEFEKPVPAFLLKKKLKNLTPECFHFCFQPKPGVAFLGASPERLYKRSGTHLQTEAIAGTKAKGKNENDNNRLKGELLTSTKDIAEHRFVKEAIESELKPFTVNLNVEPKPSILELSWGHHLKTAFDGILKDTAGDAQLLPALHPTPAVAGSPKEAAVEFIRDLEHFSRGWYAGPIGYIGQEQTEFTVAIRSGLIKGSTISLFAGAGILPQSSRKAEWNEIEQKMNSFLKVFEKERT